MGERRHQSLLPRKPRGCCAWHPFEIDPAHGVRAVQAGAHAAFSLEEASARVDDTAAAATDYDAGAHQRRRGRARGDHGDDGVLPARDDADPARGVGRRLPRHGHAHPRRRARRPLRRARREHLRGGAVRRGQPRGLRRAPRRVPPLRAHGGCVARALAPLRRRLRLPRLLRELPARGGEAARHVRAARGREPPARGDGAHRQNGRGQGALQGSGCVVAQARAGCGTLLRRLRTHEETALPRVRVHLRLWGGTPVLLWGLLVMLLWGTDP
mmetsp:Transcript_7439/g.24705  ORF Transcript_7439/g.24705 Transcript_7439/m.24705 type:complete len:270 (-) Transcript_7439:289-1098(-)